MSEEERKAVDNFFESKGIREFIRMKRIPKHLDECLYVLEQDISPEVLEELKVMKEEDVIPQLHSTWGRWIRNEWSLWDEESELHKYFKNLGIFHPDDMSGIILTSFHRKLNGKDCALEEQIKFYQDFWKEGKNGGNETKKNSC